MWNTWEPEENVRTEDCDSSDEFLIHSYQHSTTSTASRKKRTKRATTTKNDSQPQAMHTPKRSAVVSKAVTPKKRPIIVSHKMSSKKLKSIMDRLSLAKKASNQTMNLAASGGTTTLNRDTN